MWSTSDWVEPILVVLFCFELEEVVVVVEVEIVVGGENGVWCADG